MADAAVEHDVRVTSVTGALDNLSCSLERLLALHRSNHSDFGEAIENLPEGGLKDRLYQYWMIDTTIGEKLAEAERVTVATCTLANNEDFARRGGK